MRVFVTGATGYIGRRVVRALVRRGHEVHGLCRSDGKADGLRALGAQPVPGNLADPRSYASAAEAADALIHLGMDYGPSVVETDRLAVGTLLGAARAAKAPRIILYTSGVWVLGPTVKNSADETASTGGAASLVSWRPAHEQTVLGANERRVFAAVIRPGIVFGSRGGLIGAFFESARRDGASTVVGDGQNRWSPVHVDDLADLYVRIVETAWSGRLENVPAADRLFHGVDGTAEKVETIAEAASRAAGKGGKIRVQPLAEARKTLGSFADALAMDQAVASVRSEPLLGWRPRTAGFVRNAGEAFAEWQAQSS